MISSYSFSLQGRDHKQVNIPCHDYSVIKEITPSWKIAVAADGVGSCKHAEIASKIAAETVIDLISRQFPPAGSEDSIYKAVILAAMNGAANAVEMYVAQHDEGNEREYQTTLTLAVMNKKHLYYGQAGDSGLIALDTEGHYHMMTKKQNDELGRVYSLPAYRNFEIGSADFAPVAALCLTDGILDAIAPAILAGEKNCINVPFANLFISYGFGIEKQEEAEKSKRRKEAVVHYLLSDECSTMTDDLSAAVMVITESELDPAVISWEEPEIDYYKLKKEELSIYSSSETKTKLFSEYIRQHNPDWDDEKVDLFVKKYLMIPSVEVNPADDDHVPKGAE